MKILRENAIIIFLNFLTVVLLGFLMISDKTKEVRECSKELFLSGMLFEAYFVFFLVRTIILVATCFCVKSVYTFYWAA